MFFGAAKCARSWQTCLQASNQAQSNLPFLLQTLLSCFLVFLFFCSVKWLQLAAKVFCASVALNTNSKLEEVGKDRKTERRPTSTKVTSKHLGSCSLSTATVNTLFSFTLAVERLSYSPGESSEPVALWSWLGWLGQLRLSATEVKVRVLVRLCFSLCFWG